MSLLSTCHRNDRQNDIAEELLDYGLSADFVLDIEIWSSYFAHNPNFRTLDRVPLATLGLARATNL